MVSVGKENHMANIESLLVHSFTQHYTQRFQARKYASFEKRSFENL